MTPPPPPTPPSSPPPRPGDHGASERAGELEALRLENESLRARLSMEESRRGLHNLHLLQIQPVRDLLVIALVIGVLYLGYVLRPLTVPLLLALALAYLFEPLVRRMTSKGRINRSLAAITIIFTMVLVVTLPVGFGLAYGAVQGLHYGRHLQTSLDTLNASVRHPTDMERRETVEQMGRGWLWLRDTLVGEEGVPSQEHEPTQEPGEPDASPRAPPEDDPALAPQPPVDEGEAFRQYAIQALQWLNEWVQDYAATVATAFGRQAIGTGMDVLRIVWSFIATSAYLAFAAFLVLFFFFFLSVSYQRVLNSLGDLIPAWKRDEAIQMIRKMDGVVSGFVRGRLIIMCIQTVMFIVGYGVVGVPAAVTVGLVIGVLSLVPYLSLIGIPLTILLMWLQPSPPVWWWVLLAPTAIYFIVQLSDDYVWTPMIQGKATDMDVPSILFAVLAGGILAGFYGMLLAIPTAACIKILLKDAFWPRFRAWAEGRERDFLPITPRAPTDE